MRGVPLVALPLELIPSTTNPVPRPIGDGVKNPSPACGAAQAFSTLRVAAALQSCRAVNHNLHVWW